MREQIRLAVAPQAAESFNGKPQATVSETSFQRHGASRPVPSDFVDGYRAARAAPLESELPKPESHDLVPLSPLRPIFLELAAVGAELELLGEELQALFVELDLPELAITGPAVVKQIQNAPTSVVDHSVVLGSSANQPQAGRVITATFKHSSGDVIDLRVGDASEYRTASNNPSIVRVAHRPNELGSANSAAASPSSDAAEGAEVISLSDSDDSSQVIGTTSNHPFWSVDRREYVQAGKLELGERVLTYSGDTKRVLSKLARPGPQPVYNLEVFAEHVYYVGKDGVLVHNAGPRYVNSQAFRDSHDRIFAPAPVNAATTRTPAKLAEAGEDLFVGGYGQVRRANIKSGLNSTHTPHHSVQHAVSSTSHSTGVSINMRKDLHAMTRTFRKPVEEGLSLRQHLYKDVWDIKNILTNAGYDRSVINAQLKELIRQNKAVGGFGN